jgi:predicted signal transduction protein with EAL and GGDEF domain
VQLYTLIRAAQFRFLYRQLPRSFIGNMVGALVLSVVVIGERPLWMIAAWLGCMTLNQSIRLASYYKERKRDFVSPNLDRAALFWTSGAFVSGALWGATAFLFFISGHEAYQALLTILVFGAAAGAVPMIGSHMPSFYLFVLPAILPFVLRNLMEGDAVHVTISLIMSLVTLAFLSFGRSYNRLFVESLRNRFEKEMLADQLAAQNVDLEAARVEAEHPVLCGGQPRPAPAAARDGPVRLGAGRKNPLSGSGEHRHQYQRIGARAGSLVQ